MSTKSKRAAGKRKKKNGNGGNGEEMPDAEEYGTPSSNAEDVALDVEAEETPEENGEENGEEKGTETPEALANPTKSPGGHQIIGETTVPGGALSFWICRDKNNGTVIHEPKQ